MEKPKNNYRTVDAYLNALPELQKLRLEVLRNMLKQWVPEAVEVISYNMPAFRYHGILIYMAAHTNHIGFYPASATALARFRDRLKDLHTSKGTIRIGNGEEMPVELLREIILFRAAENAEKAISKGKKKV